MRYISWIWTVPIAIILVVFAASNRAPVDLKFWPFETAVTMPVFLALFLGMLITFLVGGTIAVFTGLKHRRAAASARKEVARLNTALEQAHKEIEDLKAAPSVPVEAVVERPLLVANSR